MITGILLGIFIAVYSIAEGITEGKYWETLSLSIVDKVFANTASIADLQNRLEKKRTGIAKYHSWRTLEILGFIAISITIYFVHAGFSTKNILLGISYLLGGMCWGILAYRIAFIKIRKQDTISPTWKWEIYIPGYGIKNIPYPSSFMFYILGIAGIILLVFARSLIGI